MFNKKGAMVDDVFDFLFLTLAAFLTLFFFYGSLQDGISQSELQSLQNMEDWTARRDFTTFLFSPMQVEGATISTSQLISQADLEEYKQERINSFQESADNFFTEKYSFKKEYWLDEPTGNFPWWIEIYSENDLSEEQKLKGDTFKSTLAPVEGFTYNAGFCEPIRTESFMSFKKSIVKKGPRNFILSFCSGREYVVKD